jgi:seryl-tRNA(Sec) selenium transferase
MHDDILFSFQIDKPALALLVRAVDKYIEAWPNDETEDKKKAKDIQTELHKAHLELKFLEGPN